MPENFSQHGVRMNALCPDATQTEILKTALDTTPQPEIWKTFIEGDVME